MMESNRQQRCDFTRGLGSSTAPGICMQDFWSGLLMIVRRDFESRLADKANVEGEGRLVLRIILLYRTQISEDRR